jgi:hypothetical protein
MFGSLHVYRKAVQLLFAVIVVTIFAGVETAVAIEKAQYTVVEREGRFELRQYEPHIVAETFVDAEFDGAGDVGFNRLFRYIQGNNRTRESVSMTSPVNQEENSEKIAMTAPVEQQVESGVWRVTFIMPSEYTMESLPEPLDPNVKLREEEGRLVASLRYSGEWSEKLYRENETLLLEFIAKRGLKPAGETVFARYNPPFMPPFLRRNEVIIPVVR